VPAFLAVSSTDARIEELRTSFEDFRYRAPYKFGGKEVDRVTMLNVHCRLLGKSGKSAEGFASMSMGNVWSFPSAKLTYDDTLAAMKSLAGKIERITRSFSEYAHPLDMNLALEPEYLKAAAETTRELQLSEPVPKLCVLVTASPVDAALHDAFGRLHGRNSFSACGREFVRYDLAHYLNNEFRGEFLDSYVAPQAAPRVRMYHSVGASDSLTPGDVKKAVGDGLPESLEEWIPFNGVTAIKIKLNGNDLAWDVDRVASIDRVTTGAQSKRGFRDWIYSLDSTNAARMYSTCSISNTSSREKRPRHSSVCSISSSLPPATSPPTGRIRCSKPPNYAPWSSMNRSPGWTPCCWRVRWAIPEQR